MVHQRWSRICLKKQRALTRTSTRRSQTESTTPRLLSKILARTWATLNPELLNQRKNSTLLLKETKKQPWSPWHSKINQPRKIAFESQAKAETESLDHNRDVVIFSAEIRPRAAGRLTRPRRKRDRKRQSCCWICWKERHQGGSAWGIIKISKNANGGARTLDLKIMRLALWPTELHSRMV